MRDAPPHAPTSWSPAAASPPAHASARCARRLRRQRSRRLRRAAPALHAAGPQQAGAARREAARSRSLAARRVVWRAGRGAAGTGRGDGHRTRARARAHRGSLRDVRLARARHGRRARHLASSRPSCRSRPRPAVVRGRRPDPPAPRRGHALAGRRRRLHRRRVRGLGRAHRERGQPRHAAGGHPRTRLRSRGGRVVRQPPAQARRARSTARRRSRPCTCAAAGSTSASPAANDWWSTTSSSAWASVPSTRPRGSQAGLDLALGGIAADSHLRSSAPGVYAIGDVAAYESELHGRRVRIEHWDVARAHGVHVAREIMGR